jgi:hypothetical protein
VKMSSKIDASGQSPPMLAGDPAIHRVRSQRSDLPHALALFLLVFSVYFLSYSRTLPATADEMVDYGLAQSMAKWQIFSIDQVSTVGPSPNQIGLGEHRYSKFGPLQPLLSVPLFWLAQSLPIGSVDTVLLLNHLVAALAVSVLYLLARRLGYPSWVALIVAAIAAFGTPLWVDAKRYFSEPTITLTLVTTAYCAYAAATTRRPIWHVATGFSLGAAVAAKYVDLIFLTPVPIYLVYSAIKAAAPTRLARIRAMIKSLVPLAAGALPVGIALLLYNLARFGSALQTGYLGDAAGESFSVPLWVGVPGFLWSPGKSVFVYTPVFLMLAVWGRSFARRFPAFTSMLVGIIVLHLLVFGTWIAWWGAWSWGPRFLVPLVPFLSLALAEGIATSRSRALRAAALGLGALSIAIQILGIAVDQDVYIPTLFPLNPLPDTLTIWDLRYQPIVHQIPYLSRAWLDFAWIERSGPNAVNVTALGTALAAVVIALFGGAIVWRARTWSHASIALVVIALFVGGAVYRDLRMYGQSDDPDILALARAMSAAPAGTAVLQLIPSAIVPYDNWQKRSLPELGWTEGEPPNPLILRRLNAFEQQYPWLLVVTESSPKVPSNGIEARLDRSLAQVGNDQFGRFRL